MTRNTIWGQAHMSGSDFTPGMKFTVFGHDFKCYSLSDESLIFCEKGKPNAMTEHEFALWLHAQEALVKRYGTVSVTSVADFYGERR